MDGQVRYEDNNMNIFAWIYLPSREKEALIQGVQPHHVTFAQDLAKSEKKSAFLHADIVFGNLPAAWLFDTSCLKCLQLESVGFGEYQAVPSIPELKITNLRGLFFIPVAETVVGGILSIYRGLNTLVHLKEAKQWQKDTLRASNRTLHGSRVIIVGGGSIGGTINERLQVFGAHTSVMDTYSPEADITTIKVPNQQLPDADIVIASLPETPETTGFFDQQRLTLLSPNCVFVNVGRGSTMDEASLIRKLRSNEIAGSVLDVTQEEPLPDDHLLWTCPNVILTQHTAGGSQHELLANVNLFLTNLKRFQGGQSLENIVNLKRGY